MCKECERVKRYMSADPEMYRGEDHRCDRCIELSRLQAENTRLREALLSREKEKNYPDVGGI